ncbi:MAG: hypothetical protein JNJ94_02470 [Chlorobi bacterium]|nr:hypothetical protein [Chlorobiota bacterium]
MDFLQDNFWIILGVAIWLFSSLFGDKKKKAEKEAQRKELMEKARQKRQTAKADVTRQFQEIAARQPESEGGVGSSLKALIAEAERRIQEASNEAEQPKSSPAKAAAPKPAARQQIKELVSMPDADFESFDALPTADQLQGQTEKSIERIDYDTRAEAFEFRKAINETAEQQYHTDGFERFQSAHGFTHPGGRPRVVQSVGVEEEVSPYEGMFNNPDDIRRMIILKEIFDKPLALRR